MGSNDLQRSNYYTICICALGIEAHSSEAKSLNGISVTYGSLSESGEAMENIGSFISKSGRVKFTTDIPPLDDLLARKNIKKVWYLCGFSQINSKS